MPKIDKSKIERILIITLSNIGDIILTMPVVEVLLNEFPDASLDVMVGPSGEEIFKPHKKISDIIVYNKRSSALEKFGLFVKLRKKGYDLVVDLRNTILPLVLGARFNTRSVRAGFKKRMHKKDVHLSRLRDIGIDISKSKFYIPIEESDKEYVEGLLGELEGRPFVVVSPGAKSHVKRWPLKNFAKLCDIIKQVLGYEVVLIGDENDRVVTRRILFYMKTTPLNLLEKTNIRQLAYLLKKSKLLITNDSAPLHVGSAIDMPILAFFGPTDEKKYGPLTKAKSKVLRKNIECSPCEVPQCVNKLNRYQCLKSVTVEDALEAVKELLQYAYIADTNR